MTVLPPPGTRTARQRESPPPTVAIGLFVGFVLSAAFTGLAAIVIPGVLLMVLAGFCMLVFFVLQYFLWAKWLYPIVMRMEKEASADSVPGSARNPDIHSETDA
jgi:hypothetical protein